MIGIIVECAEGTRGASNFRVRLTVVQITDFWPKPLAATRNGQLTVFHLTENGLKNYVVK